jgi:hypothetical protein
VVCGYLRPRLNT